MPDSFDFIGGDRRLTRRYPVELPLEYKLFAGDQAVGTGKGQTCNISSGGLLLRADPPLAPEGSVEISIFWPVVAQSGRPVTLIAYGHVVRTGAAGTAVQVSRYEFASEQRYLVRRSPGAQLRTGAVVARPVAKAGAAGPGAILVVESHSTQLLIRALLERKGYTVLGYNPARALRALNRHEVAVGLLITDTPQQFAGFPDLPLICLTSAHGLEPNLTPAQRVHAVIVQKPFTYHELLHAVSSLLEPGAAAGRG